MQKLIVRNRALLDQDLKMKENCNNAFGLQLIKGIGQKIMKCSFLSENALFLNKTLCNWTFSDVHQVVYMCYDINEEMYKKLLCNYTPDLKSNAASSKFVEMKDY